MNVLAQNMIALRVNSIIYQVVWSPKHVGRDARAFMWTFTSKMRWHVLLFMRLRFHLGRRVNVSTHRLGDLLLLPSMNRQIYVWFDWQTRAQCSRRGACALRSNLSCIWDACIDIKQRWINLPFVSRYLRSAPTQRKAESLVKHSVNRFTSRVLYHTIQHVTRNFDR